MSIEAVEQFTPMPAPDAAAESARPSRSLLRQAFHDTLSAPSARIGLTWLFLLAFCAVFAPFLASSHPLVMKSNGRWSSPLLHYLSPADILLLMTTGALLLIAIWRRFSTVTTAATIVIGSILAASALPTYILIKPPENPVYQQYRDDQAQGKVQWALFAPVPFSPNDRLRDQPDARLQPPNRTHWAGTDTNGADVFSNLLHASRIALSIGFLSTGISLIIGVLVGAIMGYYVGAIDLIGMRMIEILEAVPRIFLLISITAFIKHRDIYVMMAVIGATSWTGYARFLRAEFFTIRKLDYVQAAIAAGLPKRVILFRHMLANALTPILVSTTFGVASAILYESILSFLGIGLIDEASWGALLQQARAGGTGFVWWIACYPGLAIFLTVFAYNLVGEAIRDALDPKLRKRD